MCRKNKQLDNVALVKGIIAIVFNEQKLLRMVMV